MTLLGSSKFGDLLAPEARLFNEHYVGFTFQTMGDDAVKVQARLDGSFRGVTQRTEAVDELSPF